MCMRPDRSSLSSRKQLWEMIVEFHNPKIKSSLDILRSKYRFYREIRGDGNCFIRAIAFLYITERRLKSWKEIFDQMKSVNMECVSKSSISDRFLGVYRKPIMVNILN